MEKITVICFLGISIIIGLALAQSNEIDDPPANTAIVDGSSFELFCAKYQELWAIQWENEAGDQVAGADIPMPGYTVDYDGVTGTSRLTAPNANLTFAGTYKCIVMYFGAPSPAPNAFAEVIIFAEENQSCSQTPGIPLEDEDVSFTCEVGYSGSWAPIMTWTIDGTDVPGASVSNDTTGTLVKYTLVFKATAALDGKNIVCKTEFVVPDLPPDHATNAPTSPVQDWSSTALEIHFPVKEERINIEPDDGPIYVETEVTCSAPSIVPPAEKVEWRDSNGTVASGVQSATFTAEAIGSYNYSCYVEHHVGEAPGQLRTATTVFSFDVIAIPTTTTTTAAPTTTAASTPEGTSTEPTTTPDDTGGLSDGEIAGIVIGALAFVVLIILLIWFCWRKKKTSMEKDKPDASRQQQMTPVDVVRSPDPYYMEDPSYSTVNHGMSPHSSPYNTYDSKPPQDNNVENLVYADLALDDKPRSRKPVQLYDNNYDATDYAQIVRS